MTSWSTVTITKEDPEHVKAFVAWHLGAGADVVHLFYDDPETEIRDFDHLPAVKVTLCDDVFWNTHGNGRPENRAVRQVDAATVGYADIKTDWVLHCDTDEFLFGDGITNALNGVPAHINSAQILPLERIFKDDEIDQSYSNIFRAPLGRKHPPRLRKIYDHPNQLVQGLRGHRNGKVFVRTGLKDVILRAHNAEIAGILQNDPAFRDTIDTLKLLHFYTFGFSHFVNKGQWKFKRGPRIKAEDAAITSPSPIDIRRIEMAEAFESGDIENIRKIFADSFVFTPERLAQLAKIQEIQHLEFAEILETRIANYFP